ncbi:hypothetical protein RKD39_001763 [Streptomyces albogriseolus]
MSRPSPQAGLCPQPGADVGAVLLYGTHGAHEQHGSPDGRRRGARPSRRRRHGHRTAARRPVAGDRGAGRREAPGPGRPAHGLGQVRGVLRGHRAAEGPGQRTDRDRLPAPGAHAQPGRGRGPGRGPRPDHQLLQQRGVGRHPGGDRRGGRGCAAGQSRAAEQPGLPRPGAAPAGRRDRAARGRRGALHLRLGPRLPPGLPAAAHDAERSAGGGARPRHHRHGQCPGDRRRRRAARHGRFLGRARAAGSAGPGEPQPERAAPSGRGAPHGLARRPPGPAPRVGDHLHADGGRGRGGHRVPAPARTCRRLVHRADGERRTGSRPRRTCWPTR